MCTYVMVFTVEERWLPTSLQSLAERIENDNILNMLDKKNVSDIDVRGEHYKCIIKKNKAS